jgi:hypothetical protein
MLKYCKFLLVFCCLFNLINLFLILGLKINYTLSLFGGLKMPEERKRLNLDFSPEAYELLDQLATGSGGNMGDTLREGLELYGIKPEEKKEEKPEDENGEDNPETDKS